MAKESRKIPLSDASTWVRRAKVRAWVRDRDRDRDRVRVRVRVRVWVRAKVRVWIKVRARVRAATEHIDARPAGWLELL